MKKLFKEVWKSFSNSKVILIGLIILIFLSSGIITLIFDVVNSYRTQYETFKKQSIKQDVVMNTNFNLYGSAPSIFYKEQDLNTSYKNNDNLLDNQWFYIETNNYIDSININTNSEYYNLSKIIPSYSTNVYVKTKDLSMILNANLNAGNSTFNNNQNIDKINVVLNSTGNNFLETYTYENGEYVPRHQIYNTMSEIYDTYDSGSGVWTASKSASSLFSNKKFNSIVIDTESNKAYVENSLNNNKSSAEYNKYSNKKELFKVISSDEVASMLGFKKTGLIITQWKLDKTKTWILDANINTYPNEMTADDFFAQTSIPNLKSEILLPNIINNVSNFVIPTSWFIYSQYKYIFTRKKYKLEGIESVGNDFSINNNMWTGYYEEWLNNLKNDDDKKFRELVNWNYWTKDIVVNNVDKNGNIIYIQDSNGNDVIDQEGNKEIKKYDFNVALEMSDITQELKNNKGETSTIKDIEQTTNLDELFLNISTNKQSENENYINTESKKFQYLKIYEKIESLVDKMGVRETLTVSTNSNESNNVYQFINLGNSNNEIDWNGIKIKQEVGKLISTNLNNDIFSLKPSINTKSSQVPIEYVPKIIEKLLNGLSLDRSYINTTISYGSFTYSDIDNKNVKLSSKKIIWLTQNGNKNIDDIYGISSINLNSENIYFILKSSIDNTTNQIWMPLNGYEFGINYEKLSDFIIKNNLNFAPFDWYGNDINVVTNKGWAREDAQYSDNYSIPFQYLLPSSDIINDYNSALNDPNSALNNPNNINGQYGMEIFRDNLINSLTLSVKPLISAENWSILTNSINMSFSKYGFGDSLTPPAQLTNASFIKIVIGVLHDSVLLTNENFFETLFANIFDGIERYINPNGNTSLDEQQIILESELNKIFKIVELSTGSPVSLDFIIDFVNQIVGTQQYTKLSEIITNPSQFINGIKKVLASIDFDKTILEFWNNFYGNSSNDIRRTIGVGDFLPYLYKNIYSISDFKAGLKQLISSTVLANVKIADALENISHLLPPDIQSLLPLIKTILGTSTIPELIDWIVMKDTSEGYEYLKNSIKHKTNDLFNINYDTINLYDVLSLFKLEIPIGILGKYTIEFNSFVTQDDPNNDIEILYEPEEIIKLELDLDLSWYLLNYVFKNHNDKASNNVELFGIDISNILQSGISSITEIKDDYNQIVLNENLGKIAIVNQSFLDSNNKKVYHSSTLEADLNDLNKIDDIYKINVAGVEYVIIGQDFTVDYMYPVINSSNISVNTKTQALVYVNQYGYDRVKRSNVSAPTDKYFLFTTKSGMSANELQTKLNQLSYFVFTGNEYQGSDINSNSNIYKMCYLANESSLLNPERSLRLTVIEDVIKNLELIQKTVGIILFIIVSIVIIFVIRRYISSRAKVLGILKAQGYSLLEIASSLCLFPLFVSIIGATLGYIAGLLSQLSIFQLLSIFWKIPFVIIPFNWMTFILTLIIPIIFLSILTILTTFWFLSKNKSLSMMNGSMEVNQTSFANNVRKLASHISVKNRFSVSLALGSIGKLIALFISTLLTSVVTLFFIISYKGFDNSVQWTYKDKNYKYLIKYNTPTVEGGEIQAYNANSVIDFNNILYVPVGDAAEGYVYLSNYFKPGYNEIINKNGMNGNLSITDTTTPHIFTKSSVDLTVAAGGLSMNVWQNLYNAIPESQRVSITNISQNSSKWMEWTQEGIEYQLDGKTYITRFVNFGTENEYLSLWNLDSNTFYTINELNIKTGLIENKNIKIDYFNYEVDENNPENSRFVYREVKSNNSYNDTILIITGEEQSNKVRSKYRDYLVNAYNIMFNFNKNNILSNKLPEHLRSTMPEFHFDYFISPGALLLSYNENKNTNDEVFTYINAVDINNQNIKPEIIGYNENSSYVQIVDSNSNNLIKIANSFNENGIYPLIINHVVAQKYKLNIGNTLSLEITNTKNRFENKLKENLNSSSDKTIVQFKIIGINETYINEEWTTSIEIANKILGLNSSEYNGLISDSSSPISLENNLPLYSYNGYWSADNKITYSNSSSISRLTDSEKQKIINTYRQIFYNLNSYNDNISLFATNVRRIFPEYNNEQINEIISNFLNLNNLNLVFNSGSIDQTENNLNTERANSAIKKFIDIYGDDALLSAFLAATSKGMEQEYIENASSIANKGMIIIIVISFAISLTILIMISSMIISENERNIAIFGILGYMSREKIMMFFSIYIPIVLISILISIGIVWLFIPLFLSAVLSTTSILIPISLTFWHILATLGIVLFIFVITSLISWIIQGRIKPIILLKGV
ncbi:MAG: ABC transporter permease [Mycoplasma sp.]|nr:ABC transporter permease [Mycoplasma sp.]